MKLKLLLESQAGYVYLTLPIKIEDIKPHNLNKIWNIEIRYISTVDKKSYDDFKKYISMDKAASFHYNYIYRSNSVLNIFDIMNIREVRDLYDRYLNIQNVEKYYGMKWNDHKEFSTFIYDKMKSRGRFRIEEILEFCKDSFFEKYDGFIYYAELNDKSATKQVFFEKFKNNCTLIDGVIPRFGQHAKIEVDFPTWVIKELERYTNDAAKKINSEVKKWLKENTPKRYESKRIYRGFRLDIHDWGSYEKATLEDLMKKVKKATGIKNLTDIHVGQKMYSSRGKESSWSTTPQTAKNFTSGMAEGSINFLIYTEIKPEQVVIDFTELSEDFKKNFKFAGQNEVIVDTGKIPVIISEVWVEKKMKEWLNKNGYDYKKNYGIIEL